MDRPTDRYVAAKDSRGWRVKDTVTGTLASARIMDRNRAVRQARIMSDDLARRSRKEGRYDMESMREVTVQTDLHRAMGSSGIVARIDASGKVVAWKLADGGSWTTADLRAAQVTFDVYASEICDCGGVGYGQHISTCAMIRFGKDA